MKVRYPYVDPVNVLQVRKYSFYSSSIFPFFPSFLIQAEIMRRLRRINAELASNPQSSSAAASTGSIHIPAADNKASERSTLSLEEEKQLLEDSLVVSINGIAQGMKNSG